MKNTLAFPPPPAPRPPAVAATAAVSAQTVVVKGRGASPHGAPRPTDPESALQEDGGRIGNALAFCLFWIVAFWSRLCGWWFLATHHKFCAWCQKQTHVAPLHFLAPGALASHGICSKCCVQMRAEFAALKS